MLEDAHTAVGTIDPLTRFGASAFGPIQLRAVSAEGITGDWVPVGTLVRLPGFAPANALRCPRSSTKPCLLMGTNLFLITAVGSTPDMANAVDVPAEFTGTVLTVPNVGKGSGSGTTGAGTSTASGPTGTLYVRLRDDPETVQTLSLPISPAPPGAAPAEAPASEPAAAGGSASAAVPPTAPHE